MTNRDLYIVRHGKASQPYSNILDIDRPLEERGIADSYVMADRLKDKNRIPGKIISSPAIRALHTATIFARVFNYPYHEITILKDIYINETKTLLNSIKAIENSITSLMIVGHNPGFTDLSNHFLEHRIDSLPTAGLVGLRFESDSWLTIDQCKPIKLFVDFPKNIH